MDDDPIFESSDLSLLFLFRSHTEICQSLGPLVESRMRRTFLRGWKEKMAVCFSRTMREVVREGLDKGKCIDDIFVLCKVTKRYMRLVFRVEEKARGAHVLAKEDFYWTEYLHRAVVAMDTIRNRAFHGASVYQDEVMASISHGLQTMSLLTRTSPDERVDRTLNSLRLLKKEFADFLNGQATEVCVSAEERTDVLLHTCLAQLEKDLRRLLRDTFPGELGNESRKNGDLTQLVDFLKSHVNRRELRVRQTAGTQSQQLTLACKIVKEVRNIQAHTRAGGTDPKWLRKKIEKALVPWTAYDFDLKSVIQVLRYPDQSRQTSLTGKGANSMLQHWAAVPVEMPVSSAGHYLEGLTVHRATRSKGGVFVGRERELQDGLAFFSQDCQEGKQGQSKTTRKRKLLVVDGASGVGKTSLAGQLLDELHDRFPRQMWLCASTPEILTVEVSSHLLSEDFNSGSSTDQICSLPEAARVINMLAEELIVLDDVTVEALEVVEQLFVNSDHSMIITTCSRQFHRLQKFASTFSKLFCISLLNIRTESSLRLLKLRGISVDGCEVALRQIVETDFENLQLAVSIFTSLVQERLRCEKEQTRGSTLNAKGSNVFFLEKAATGLH